MKKLPLLSLLIFFCLVQIKAQQIPFQGYLEESNIPVTGSRDINFEITKYGWTELHTAVTIDKGLYSIVLGSIAALPDSIFYQVDAEDVNITIGGTLIGTFQLYKPVSGNYAAQKGGNVQINNPSGQLRADLNYLPNNDAASLVLYGANDSRKAILGTGNGGYTGFLGLYDSLGSIGARINVTPKGQSSLYTFNEGNVNAGWFGTYNNDGFAQLVSFDDSFNTSGALLLGSFADGKFPELYIEGTAQQNFGLGRFRVMNLGNSTEETAMLEINRSNGGGQAKLLIGQDDGPSDPTGANGILELWGDSSPNYLLGAASYKDHDLANMSMYGAQGDGTGWFLSAVDLGVERSSDLQNEFGFINLNKNTTSSIGNRMASFSANLNDTGASGLELFDDSGQRTVFLEGSTGFIEAVQGIHLGDFLDNSVLIDNGDFQIYGGGTGGFSDDGQITAEFSNNGLNGRLLLYGFSDGGFNQNKVIMEAVDDLSGNTYGRATFFDGVGVATVTVEGVNGNINASGIIAANILQSTSGTVQTSDRRYKKEIYTLKNALDNVNKLRGTTYYWRDEKKSKSQQIGVIAQEVEEIYPEFVHTNEEGYKSVNYAQMTAVLIEAIKELNAKVTTLETENGTLKASLEETAALNARLERVEKLLLIQAEQQSN